MLPSPPAMWSYSSLKEVEACPRRYALSHADYPQLWGKSGYPRTPLPAAIKGDVIHGSLEVIIKAMIKAGCRSTRSAEAVAVLRDLGGYSAVAKGVLGRLLARFDGNPRVPDDRREQLTRVLMDWLPEAREQLQTYLSRLELSSSNPPASSNASQVVGLHQRCAVGTGVHPEVELIAEELRLYGRVDLLAVGDTGAVIIDFKTGAEDAAHQEQLRLYALLWHADTIANPGDLPVSSLVAAYPNREVAVDAPLAKELPGLKVQLKSRIDAADASVTAGPPPEARTGDYCSTCNVRPLCDTYWSVATRRTRDVPYGAWYDLQGTVIRGHGVKSWLLRETAGGAEVLVRTPTPSTTLPVGHTVRILGARRTVDPDEEDALIATLATASETFELVD